MKTPVQLMALVLVCQLAIVDCRYPGLLDWRSKQKRKQRSDADENFAALNVSSSDSPYALIHTFFSQDDANLDKAEKQTPFEKSYFSGNRSGSLGKLHPKEVWLMDGGLLVLKGGSTPTGPGFDQPWEPLDDYQAPYREPVLPPADFVPVDTGVGVPLPPEEDDEDFNEIKDTDVPIKQRFSFDEDAFIQQMENFHSIRSAFHPSTDQMDSNPDSQNPTVTPSPAVPTSTAARTTTPSDDYFVATSTPDSFSYSFRRTDSNHIRRSTTTVTPIPATTTTPTTARPVLASSSTSSTGISSVAPDRPAKLLLFPRRRVVFRKKPLLPVDSNALDSYQLEDVKAARRDDLTEEPNGRRRRKLWPTQVRQGKALRRLASVAPAPYPRPHLFASAQPRGPGDHVSYFRGNIAGRSWGYIFGH